tara:strand:+ start:15470 stop:16042 length:573 start_codon:yes stop_codon:yes gene_type:complete
MYIISGKYRGKKLLEPERSDKLRPTSNKNLKNIINILYSGGLLESLDIKIAEIKLLDLFAGTGIFSFENLSQNISSTTLVDINQKNLNIIRRNSKLIGEEGNIHTIKCDLKNGLPKLKQKYNLIFIDPPYNKNLTEKIFLDLENLNYLEKKHLIIIESAKKEELKFNRYKFKILKERIYGNSRFGFLTKS